MQEAIGDRFHAVLVDNGVLRTDEARIVRKTLDEHLGVNLTVVDASNRFLEELKRVSDPEKKRKIIGRLFIEVFQETAEQISKKAENTPAAGPIDWLLQGTLYPDVIESISYKGPSATIKSHHNVGGLPKDMKLKVIEPLRELYKSEVRILGRSLGIPEDLVMRHPFPGPFTPVCVLSELRANSLRRAWPRYPHYRTSRCREVGDSATSRFHLHRRDKASGFIQRHLAGLCLCIRGDLHSWGNGRSTCLWQRSPAASGADNGLYDCNGV